MDPYYKQKQVSNSDLSAIKRYFQPSFQLQYDTVAAYRFGNLFDAMLTEPNRVDYFKKMVGEDQCTDEEFERCNAMKKAFRKHPMGQMVEKMAVFQYKCYCPDLSINYDDFEFKLAARCKYDFYFPTIRWGGDLKSTSATNQKQFLDAVEMFDWDRQRAWYMDVAGADQDIIIGISKVNQQIFTLPIRRDGKTYQRGREKYEELAFKWCVYFKDLI